MWYVIQTVAGREQELAELIGKMLTREREEKIYKRCFVLYRECVWRLEGRLRFHTEPLFPSYVFVETEEPGAFYIALKQLSKLARLLGADGCFWPIGREEEIFLRSLLQAAKGDNPGQGKDSQEPLNSYLIRCSLVRVNEERQIISAEGALKHYLNNIVKQRLRKRSVIIEVPFLGEKKRIQLGIRLEEDCLKKTM